LRNVVKRSDSQDRTASRLRLQNPNQPEAEVDEMDPSVEMDDEDIEPSAADNLNSLVQECGLAPHKITELMEELPSPRMSDALIDYYFDAMYVHYYIFTA
jgi:hypothetical protein